MSYIFFYFIIFFGNAKFCHVRPVPPYPFWLSDESRSTCPALLHAYLFPKCKFPCNFLFLNQMSLCGTNCQSSILFWILVFLQSSFARHLPNQTIIKWSSTVAPICKLWERERERERERLWVERWGKEIELKEVYGYGCVGKEIYCISLPIPPIPFISFGSFLSPLLSHLCITLFVHQRYHLFILLSNDFISESSFHFPLPCLYSLYITLIENWKKKIVNIFNYFFSFSNFFLNVSLTNAFIHLSAKSMKKWGKKYYYNRFMCDYTYKVNRFMYDRTHKVNWLKLWLWMHYWLRMKIRMTYLRS